MGVGLGDGDGGVVKEVVAEGEVAEADSIARLAVGFRLERVGHSQEWMRRLRRGCDSEDGDGEGMTLGDDVVFDGVFDKELEADGWHVEGKVLGRDVLVDMKVAAVANLHHVDVGVGEGKLLLEGYLLGVLHGVAESGGKLLEIVMGVAVVGADEPVEGVEGVEEEVGTDLLLEGLVAGEYVLGLELLVFEDKLLAAGDVVEEEGDKRGDECRSTVGDEGDGKGIGGIAGTIDGCFGVEREEGEEGSDGERTGETGGHEGRGFETATDKPEIEEVKGDEQQDVGEKYEGNVEGGFKGMSNWREGSEDHHHGEDEGGSEGYPQGTGGAVELDRVEGGNPLPEWMGLYVGVVFHDAAGKDEGCAFRTAKIRVYFYIITTSGIFL